MQVAGIAPHRLNLRSYSKHSSGARLHSCLLLRQRYEGGIAVVVRAAGAGAGPSGPELPEQWWDNLKQSSIQGPDAGSRPPGADDDFSGVAEFLLGKKGYRQLEGVDKDERQRVWDAMRASAWDRYQKGELPEWFNPDWLMQEEAPINRMLRLEGNEVYQSDDTWGGGGGSGGPGKGSGGNGGNDDPYWPLRDRNEHPMRWWTLAFAAFVAIGGVLTHAQHGSAESLWVSGIFAAVMAMCGMAMSDMTDWGHGPLAVKVAWAACALLAAKEAQLGWQHRPAPREELALVPWSGHSQPKQPARFGGCASACVAMCVMYMWTGMSGLDEWALPPNPGSVYKNPDVSLKHRIWQKWGYGDAPMRT